VVVPNVSKTTTAALGARNQSVASDLLRDKAFSCVFGTADTGHYVK
jgi:hypothetical protein